MFPLGRTQLAYNDSKVRKIWKSRLTYVTLNFDTVDSTMSLIFSRREIQQGMKELSMC